jgi:hypothetical protein
MKLSSSSRSVAWFLFITLLFLQFQRFLMDEISWIQICNWWNCFRLPIRQQEQPTMYQNQLMLALLTSPSFLKNRWRISWLSLRTRFSMNSKDWW